MHKVLICGTSNFNKMLKRCLKQDFKSILVKEINNSTKKIFKNNFDTVIFNCIEKRRQTFRELEIILKQTFGKIIFIEDAKQLYLSTGNSAPFSVYQDISTEDDNCNKILELENMIKKKSLLFLEFRNFMENQLMKALYTIY